MCLWGSFNCSAWRWHVRSKHEPRRCQTNPPIHTCPRRIEFQKNLNRTPCTFFPNFLTFIIFPVFTFWLFLNILRRWLRLILAFTWRLGSLRPCNPNGCKVIPQDWVTWAVGSVTQTILCEGQQALEMPPLGFSCQSLGKSGTYLLVSLGLPQLSILYLDHPHL